MLCVNFLFDPRIENGTIKKQQLESKVACYQHENFRSNLDSSVSYDCHALLINTCICMQSACLGATIVSLLFNKSSLIPTLQRITSNSISWMSKLFSTDNFADCYSQSCVYLFALQKSFRETAVEESPKRGPANYNPHGTLLT